MHLEPRQTVVASPEAEAEAGAPRGTGWRRKLLWAALLLLLLAVVGFVLPLVNANRYRGKIAESMSKSLGRPVHLDNVSLHLLPVPGFTLQNLVVSEDPAFGAEPTIRANTVEATLRVSSLWRRPVEFSTVRFVEPSVNLVRNAEGRWNLSGVLLNASHVQSAPTDERKAGPKPRFPYIEATGGRVNIKLGAEKLPFSLTDADFALWLPSRQQWRVRLVGSPARTDTNITDPGRLRIEGELRHAGSAAEIPVDFRASWHNAPLGEATRILTGDDRGWRGSLNVDATLTGTLGDGRVASKLTLGGLRRGEFFPAHPLDLQVTCLSGFTLHPASLADLTCSLPDDAPQPLLLHAASVRPQLLRNTAVSLDGQDIPSRWALLWAALFSERISADLAETGTVDVHLKRDPAGAPERVAAAPRSLGRTPSRLTSLASPAGSAWSGALRLSLPQPGAEGAAGSPSANVLVWNAEPSDRGGFWPALRLLPTPLVLGPDASLTMDGDLNTAGYRFGVNGTAPAAALLQPARYLPQLGDGLEAVLPPPPAGNDAQPVHFTCTRSWYAVQSCTPNSPGDAETVRGAALPSRVKASRHPRRR